MRYTEIGIDVAQVKALLADKWQLYELPTDRDELIFAYQMRFVSLAFEEFREYSEISTIDQVEGLIEKYGIREKAEKAGKDGLKSIANDIIALAHNKEWLRDITDLMEEYARREAVIFVTAKRPRLRRKALAVMSVDELNEKELKYLQMEGEFWYNEKEGAVC